MFRVSDVQAIRDTLRGITAAWRGGRVDELHRFYRPDVVFAQPGFGGRLEGREVCVESYREFLNVATVHDYAEDEPVIDLLGDVAVGTIRFEVDYELEGVRHRETGHDVLVLVRDGDSWRVAWRTLVPGPAPA